LDPEVEINAVAVVVNARKRDHLMRGHARLIVALVLRQVMFVFNSQTQKIMGFALI
tara:strand:- start:250 stop:417 length:168 start_codon:yes stop_codon:yes gene_type:complete